MLIDDTESTGWRSLTGPVDGRQVTVDLAGDTAVPVGRVQVSAMLRPAKAGDPETPGSGQNRFTALDQFQALACDATKADCSQDASYSVVFTSPKDAFPSGRPRAPGLLIRSFDLKETKATHLRLRVVSSQCTGNPVYAGEQDNDPRSTTDCTAGGSLSGRRPGGRVPGVHGLACRADRVRGSMPAGDAVAASRKRQVPCAIRAGAGGRQ